MLVLLTFLEGILLQGNLTDGWEEELVSKLIYGLSSEH